MPCSKFISLRFEPGADTRVYVDDMSSPKHTLRNLREFRIESPPDGQTHRGAAVTIEAMRWPPTGYDGAVTIGLSSQWAAGVVEFETNDTTGYPTGRAFPSLDFEYDAAAGRLAWNQSRHLAGKLQGSVEFNATTPVWYVTLRLDSRAPNGTQGRLLVNGADIS